MAMDPGVGAIGGSAGSINSQNRTSEVHHAKPNFATFIVCAGIPFEFRVGTTILPAGR
jgi:hypothetical protein